MIFVSDIWSVAYLHRNPNTEAKGGKTTAVVLHAVIPPPWKHDCVDDMSKVH